MNQIPNIEETHSTRGWEDEFVEQGANLEHERWAKWQAYLHSKLYEIDDHRVSYNNHLKILPTELYERWERQIATPYKDLSEAEKESDRKEARTYLPLIHQQLQKAREEEREKARDLYQGLQMMFDQYCPNGDHQYMMAGETAEELLDMYTDLQCDCEKAPEQQEWDGHTRYCKALTHSELDQDKK